MFWSFKALKLINCGYSQTNFVRFKSYPTFHWLIISKSREKLKIWPGIHPRNSTFHSFYQGLLRFFCWNLQQKWSLLDAIASLEMTHVSVSVRCHQFYNHCSKFGYLVISASKLVSYGVNERTLYDSETISKNGDC